MNFYDPFGNQLSPGQYNNSQWELIRQQAMAQQAQQALRPGQSLAVHNPNPFPIPNNQILLLLED